MGANRVCYQGVKRDEIHRPYALRVRNDGVISFCICTVHGYEFSIIADTKSLTNTLESQNQSLMVYL